MYNNVLYFFVNKLMINCVKDANSINMYLSDEYVIYLIV